MGSLERTAAAVYFTRGRASRVGRRGRSTALRYMAPAHWMISVAVIVGGGCHRTVAPPNALTGARSESDVDRALLPHVEGIDETPQPGDVYKEYSKIGKVNESLFERQIAARDQVFARLEPRWRQATPDELINGMRVSAYGLLVPSNDVEYLVWRDGNKRIEEELLRRGESARDALRRHVDDPPFIFTGSNGPIDTIGWMCKRLLEKLDGAGRAGGRRGPPLFESASGARPAAERRSVMRWE